MGRDKPIVLKVDMPAHLQESAVKAVWWDGARTGAGLALFAGLILGYMLWRR